MNAVRDHFGVRFRSEFVAELHELVVQFLVILDDAVVDDRDAVARHMRVGIPLVRHAMRRPARVGDSEVARSWRGGQRLGKLRHLADGAQARDMGAAIQHSDARRVIAPVFEALQAFDEDRDDVPVSDRSNDSAHRPDILF